MCNSNQFDRKSKPTTNQRSTCVYDQERRGKNWLTWPSMHGCKKPNRQYKQTYILILIYKYKPLRKHIESKRHIEIIAICSQIRTK
ncbi:hypothetical protein CsatB_017293 [Cannabis sativa]